MKLATLKSKNSRDGELIVVSRDNKKAVKVPLISPSLREAVESWSKSQPQLLDVYEKLNSGTVKGEFEVKIEDLLKFAKKSEIYHTFFRDLE